MVLQFQCVGRDPRRNQPLLDWLIALPFDFQGESAFTSETIYLFVIPLYNFNIVTKTLGLWNMTMEALGTRFDTLSDKYVSIIFDNADTGYAEVCLREVLCTCC